MGTRVEEELPLMTTPKVVEKERLNQLTRAHVGIRDFRHRSGVLPTRIPVNHCLGSKFPGRHSSPFCSVWVEPLERRLIQTLPTGNQRVSALQEEVSSFKGEKNSKRKQRGSLQKYLDPWGQARGNWQTTHKKIFATKVVKTRIKINLCELEDLKENHLSTRHSKQRWKVSRKKKSQSNWRWKMSLHFFPSGAASPTIKPQMPTVVSVLK